MAVINIGSGSVKLYLSSTGKTESRVTLLNSNTPQATRETFSAVACFYSVARAAGESIAIFGTEAMRKSGDILAAQIKSELGITVDIIDGQTEAKCGFFGAASQNTGNQCMTVIDVGGASTELSAGKTAPIYSCSLPIGSVALYGRFGERETPDCAFLPDVFGFIDCVLKNGVNFSFGDYNNVVLIGGSGNNLDSLFAAQRLDPTKATNKNAARKRVLSFGKTAFDMSINDIDMTNGATVASNHLNLHMGKCASDESFISSNIQTEKIPNIINELFSLTPPKRSARYPFIDEKRALVLPYGLCIIYRALCFLNASAARSSKAGLIEGYIMHKKL